MRSSFRSIPRGRITGHACGYLGILDTNAHAVLQAAASVVLRYFPAAHARLPSRTRASPHPVVSQSWWEPPSLARAGQAHPSESAVLSCLAPRQRSTCSLAGQVFLERIELQNTTAAQTGQAAWR